MRIFAKEWVSKLLQRLGMEEGVPIESGMITRRIEGAQKAVEGRTSKPANICSSMTT
jgi:preprotein translocase subunit SecA